MLFCRKLLKIQIIGISFLMIGCNSNTALVPPNPKPTVPTATATAKTKIAPLEWNPATRSYQSADRQETEKTPNVDATPYSSRAYNSYSDYTPSKQYTKKETKRFTTYDVMVELCASYKKTSSPSYKDCKKLGF